MPAWAARSRAAAAFPPAGGKAAQLDVLSQTRQAEQKEDTRAGALQDAGARHGANEFPPGFGVRRPSGAFVGGRAKTTRLQLEKIEP
jgi:hypothetical protein